jgi:hypothetical protein
VITRAIQVLTVVVDDEIENEIENDDKAASDAAKS